MTLMPRASTQRYRVACRARKAHKMPLSKKAKIKKAKRFETPRVRSPRYWSHMYVVGVIFNGRMKNRHQNFWLLV